jgi:lipoprotein-releasing system permease protein
MDLANLDFQVTGGFESGRNDVDSLLVYVDRRYLHDLRYGKGSTRPDCTEVHVALASEYRWKASEIKQSLQTRHHRLKIESWEDRNVDLLNALNVEKRTMTLVLGLLVLISTSLLLALLYMMVLEKTRDIGVLRSMGMSPWRVRGLFVGYGTVLGLIGTTLGVCFGILAVRNLNEVTEWLDHSFGVQVFSREVLYKFREIPTDLSAKQVAVIGITTVIITVLASGVSAWKASRYDPIRCLRHE